MQKPYNTANVCAEALITRMQKALSAIQAGAKKIKNAFLLPDAAGLIGSVSPDFRKSLYMPILDAYAHMRRCAEAIENAPAFTEKTARAHAVCTRKTRQIETECTNRRAEILQKIKADTGAAITRTNAVLCTPPSAAIFAENAEHAPLSLGTLRLALPSGKMFTAPLTCTKLDCSVLFLTDNTCLLYTSLRHGSANLFIFIRVMQVIDNFGKVLLRFVLARNVRKLNAVRRLHIHLCLSLIHISGSFPSCTR